MITISIKEIILSCSKRLLVFMIRYLEVEKDYPEQRLSTPNKKRSGS
ncbi:MAG TPA: hypothetical protein VN704_06475 [Verrucomicrobiae bacterium]|nr:hypothetical protein [Verrucomicrobiae bacterium]